MKPGQAHNQYFFFYEALCSADKKHPLKAASDPLGLSNVAINLSAQLFLHTGPIEMQPLWLGI